MFGGRFRLRAAAAAVVAVAVVSGCAGLHTGGSPAVSTPVPPPSTATATELPTAAATATEVPTAARPATAAPVTAQPGGLGGGDAVYLETSPGAVVLVRWTELNGQLNGVFTVTQASASATTGTTTSSTAFTGLVDHHHLSLTLNHALGETTTLTGSLAGDRLLLTVPQPDGQLADAALQAASINTYNDAVAQLADQGQQALADAQSSAAAATAQASAAAVQASAAAVKAQQDQVVTQAVDRLSTALDDVDQADQDLRSLDPTLTGELAAETAARRTVDQRYAAARTTSRQCGVQADGDLGSAVGDVEAADGDVQSAEGTVEGQADTVTSAIDAVNSAVSDARTALADLQDAQRQYPGSADQAETGAAQAVKDTTGPATTRSQTATKTVTHSLATATSIEKSSQKVVDEANALTSC